MPTNKIPTTIYLTRDERDQIDQAARKKRLSVASYIRVKLGLKPLVVGAPKQRGKISGADKRSEFIR